MDVISYGLDYVRFAVDSDADIEFAATQIPYIDVGERWFHGRRFLDLTGTGLSVIRMVEDVTAVLKRFAWLWKVTRLDVYVDVQGNHVGEVAKQQNVGTVIMNNKQFETVYSDHLKARGRRAQFGRCYNATLAGHYQDIAATRFEIEYKRQAARAILNEDGFCLSPIACALKSIDDMFGVSIKIPDVEAIELNAPTQRLAHPRERFYERYGRGIMNDVETLGMSAFITFVLEASSRNLSAASGERRGYSEKEASEFRKRASKYLPYAKRVRV